MEEETERLREILAFINLYYDNPLNFMDAYRMFQEERKIYPDHTTYYGNDLRLTEKNSAKHLLAKVNSNNIINVSEYNEFMANFMKDVSDEIMRSKPGRIA